MRNRFEHRLYVGRRGGDYPKDLTGSGLLGKRLRKIAVADLQLFEEPDVLDRYHCLIGEGFEKRYLFLGERSDFQSTYENRPDRHAFAQEGSCKRCAMTNLLLVTLDFRIFRINLCRQVMDMNCFPVHHRTTRRRLSI